MDEVGRRYPPDRAHVSAPAWTAGLAGPALRWFVVLQQSAPGFDQPEGVRGFQLVEDCEHTFVQGAGQYVIHLELFRWGFCLMRTILLRGSDNF